MISKALIIPNYGYPRMISGKVAAVIAVAILAVFSSITIEIIDHSGSSLSTSSLSNSASQISIYSPLNGTNLVASSANYSFNFTISVDSRSTSVYIYDLSPDNLTSFQKPGSPQLYSLPNLTLMNVSLHPYNYMETNVTTGKNTTLNMSLHLNPTDYSKMKQQGLCR